MSLTIVTPAQFKKPGSERALHEHLAAHILSKIAEHKPNANTFTK